MPIDLPDLDDRRYSDLMEEALRLIPAHAPEWTNHNPSDPGITLIELFAYLTEMLIYRLNRVIPENVLAFLKLINGPGWNPCCPELNAEAWNELGLLDRDSKIRGWWQRSSVEERSQTVAETVRQLRKPVRAVSSTDFEALAREADERVARVHCIPGNGDGYIRVIVVPDPKKTGGFDLSKDLKSTIQSALRDRCLLTTQLDVEDPKLAKVGVQLTLVLEADASEQDARDSAKSALTGFLDPLKWPFGQAIYISKVTELFADLPGIREVRDIKLSVTPKKLPVTDKDGKVIVPNPIDPDALAIVKDPIVITIERVST
jgi:baseplate J-like protein